MTVRLALIIWLAKKNIKLNRTGLKANALRDEIIAKAKSAYFKRTKQRCQAKHYLWSAALNIKADTTMAELEDLAWHITALSAIKTKRIALNETARAYNDARAFEYAKSDDIQVVKIQMSKTHPRTDICDYYAGVDK